MRHEAEWQRFMDEHERRKSFDFNWFLSLWDRTFKEVHDVQD